ncbi:sugar isomerase, partial [SAR202 cluster bacterium AD-804-J14_MRT_500m]|nr:sugar isomerase [SAR202 cluster bacterium AD-804-J14_MRT_500m]
MKDILDSISDAHLEPLLSVLRERRDSGGQVYIAGNGGSAANASHAATHLRECGIKAICLNDSASHVTAIG